MLNLKIFFSIVIFATFFTTLSTINYADTLWTQYGEAMEDNYPAYGAELTTIDFNGDDIDDLIVSSRRLENGTYYFYLGGEDFDNESDYILQKAVADTATYRIASCTNVGDVNGDGYDDLLTTRSYKNFTDYLFGIEIYYCGPDEFDFTPDFVYLVSRDLENTDSTVHPIGDVNGDGYADFGLIRRIYDVQWYEGRNHFYIFYGSAEGPIIDYFAVLGYFDDEEDGYHSTRFASLGDVNNDNYSDFIVQYYTQQDGTKNRIFFGANLLDSIPGFEIGNFNSGEVGFNCGDYNGDGINDFIGYNGGTWEEYDIKMWFGTENELTSEPDIYLLAENTGKNSKSYGDFNNDGFDDFIMTSKSLQLFDGILYLYLGGNCNSTSYDMTITPDEQDLNWSNGEFGTAVTSGDYNNDGLDDFVVGAPDQQGRNTHPPYHNGQGRVFVFSGNEDLAEIDPVNNSDDNVVVVNEIYFNAFPNPFNPSIRFEVKAPTKYKDLTIEIYNIKGQKVDQLKVDHHKLTVEWNADKNTSGVYFCKLTDNKQLLKTQKVTLLK